MSKTGIFYSCFLYNSNALVHLLPLETIRGTFSIRSQENMVSVVKIFYYYFYPFSILRFSCSDGYFGVGGGGGVGRTRL